MRASLAILKEEPERVARLNANGNFLQDGLRDVDYDTSLPETPIVPVILRDETSTALLARGLRDLGVLVTPVMFPAVPQGSARLRLCVTAAHTQQDLEFALDAFSQLRR